MTPLAAKKVHEAADLAALWLFESDGRPALGLLERDAAASRSRLVLGLLERELRVVRRIDNDDVRIRAADAMVAAGELVFVLEINQDAPLQLARARLPALLQPRTPPPALTDQRPLELASHQVAAVQLKVADLWNVADRLGPRRWLFNPRLVRGQREPLVVANAADGQAFAVADAGSATAAMPPLPDAAEPQALRVGDRLHLAFLRGPTAYRPYWELPRYGGRPADGARRLFVIADRSSPLDLSAAFGLGSVASFALAAGDQGEPWLFVLHAAPARPELTALRLGAEGWVRAARLDLDGAAGSGAHLGALWLGGTWHLVWAEGGLRSAARYAAWRQ